MLFGQMGLLAQVDGGDAAAGAAGAAVAGVGLVTMAICAAVVVVLVAANWKVYSKADKPGWACIIPIYNIVMMLEIVGRPTWWVILALFPCTAPIVLIIIMLDLAKSFGKDNMFAAGLILLNPIFLAILGFGEAEYQGPAALAGGGGDASAGGGGDAPMDG